MIQLGWTLKILSLVREATHNRSHIGWVHFYRIPGMSKSRKTEAYWCFPGAGEGGEAREWLLSGYPLLLLGDENILKYIKAIVTQCGERTTCRRIVHFKVVNFMLREFHAPQWKRKKEKGEKPDWCWGYLVSQRWKWANLGGLLGLGKFQSYCKPSWNNGAEAPQKGSRCFSQVIKGLPCSVWSLLNNCLSALVAKQVIRVY